MPSGTPSPLRIAFIQSYGPEERSSWAITQRQMRCALEGEFAHVGCIAPSFYRRCQRAGNRLDRVLRRIFGGSFNRRFNLLSSRVAAWEIRRGLRAAPYDFVVAPTGSLLVAHLRTTVPICYLSDTSFRQIVGYYPEYTRDSDAEMAAEDALEQRAIRRASLLVYPSDWAADYVVENYGAARARVAVIPFGANLDPLPTRAAVLPKPLTEPWNLLFLGLSWERKGGDVALAAVDQLAREGRSVRLVVCGCVPPVTHPCLAVIPYLDPFRASDRARLGELLTAAHLLLLPTRAEAFGIVFGEAAAYGVPSVTRATGGAPAAVREGVNGMLLPPEAGPEAYAAKVAELLGDPGAYTRLSESARNRFEQELNWPIWARRMRTAFERTLVGEPVDGSMGEPATSVDPTANRRYAERER